MWGAAAPSARDPERAATTQAPDEEPELEDHVVADRDNPFAPDLRDIVGIENEHGEIEAFGHRRERAERAFIQREIRLVPHDGLDVRAETLLERASGLEVFG